MTSWEESVYDDNFYGSQQGGSYESAKIVLKYLMAQFSVSDLVDVGCGRGGWLKAGLENGVTNAVGYDGPWVKSEQLLSDEIIFNSQQLDKDFEISNHFDLAICLEVAEHLEEDRAKNLIKTLCASSEVVLFGAAIVGQGGNHHINERSQSYWAEVFSSNGYQYLDVIRPVFWNNKNVVWWYKQNSLLYVKEEFYGKYEGLFKDSMTSKSYPLDIVHPDCLQEKAERFSYFEKIVHKPTVRFSLGSLRLAIRNMLKK